MARGAATFALSHETRILLTTEEAANALGRCRAEFSRLITDAPDDPAVKHLLAGRSGSGRLTRWHILDVAEAAASLRGRDWPVKRASTA